MPAAWRKSWYHSACARQTAQKSPTNIQNQFLMLLSFGAIRIAFLTDCGVAQKGDNRRPLNCVARAALRLHCQQQQAAASSVV